MEAVFIEEVKVAYVPYFIEKATAINSDELFLKCEGIYSKESAHNFIKKNVWLIQEYFAKIADTVRWIFGDLFIVTNQSIF